MSKGVLDISGWLHGLYCSSMGDDQLWREKVHTGVHLVIAIVICSGCLK